MQTVNIGRTGIETSYLGFGTGTHGWSGSSDQTRIGYNKLVNLLKSGYDQGVVLWDSADGYGSHPHLADALKDFGRSSVNIITKTHSRSPENIRDEIHRFLKELGTDYIDILLMHCITSESWLKDYSDVIDVFQEIKKNGLARAIGMSCHNFGALKTVASAYWIDVVLARINYDGMRMDAEPDDVVPVLKDIHSAGKGVIGMKVIGQGGLNQNVQKAMEFIQGLSCVDAIVVGMTDEFQLQQNINLLS
jgi:predicted aldo/keto reductase-like oxidoreductase